MRPFAVIALALLAAIGPAPANAHDAFGDLGPFYASLLHPLADPLHAALVLGTAAFLAGRPLAAVRPALPLFVAAAALSAFALAMRPGLAPAPLWTAVAALGAGLAATLPARWTPGWAGVALVTATGALAGLAAEAPAGNALLQGLSGQILGIAMLGTLLWFGLETAGRRLTPLVPQVAGSWVAALGILGAAVSP